MKKRNLIIAAALAGIMLVAGCKSNDTKTEGTTTTTTTTAAAEKNSGEDAAKTDEKDNTAEASSAEESGSTEEEPAATEEEPAATEEGTDNNGGDSANSEGTNTAPFNEVIIREGEAISFTETVNAMRDILGGNAYTLSMKMNITNGQQEGEMHIVAAADPELGVYADTSMGIIATKTILKPDGTLYIIDDANKNYVKTTQQESGMTISTDNSQVIVPVKEDITTADLVQFPNGTKCYYRFYLAADNIANTNGEETSTAVPDDGIYVYFDADTKSLTNMYYVTQGIEYKCYTLISGDADKSMFELPAGYTEVTLEEYQKNLVAAMGISVPDAE